MFKSFSDSIRSLWQSKTTETVQASGKKRKRPSDDTDLDDSDVEIVMVKKPRQGNANSSSGLLSFLTIPMSKMSDWVRKKTAGQEHIFVQPVPKRTTQASGRGAGDEQGLLCTTTRSSVHSLTTNGSFTYTQSDSLLSRPPIHNHNGACENGVNGDVHIVGVQPGPCNLSPAASRRSSSSSVRAGRGRRTTVEQCFQLKEKEDYRRLLQQYTSIALGYDTDPQQTNAEQASSIHNCRNPGLSKPSPSSSSSTLLSSLPSSNRLCSKPQSLSATARLRVRPSHFIQRPSLPSDRVGENSSRLALSGKQSVGTPERRGRTQQSHGPSPTTPVRSRQHQGKSCQDKAERQQVEIPSSSSDSDPEVIIVEDMNGSTSGQSPSLNFLSSQYLDEDWINRLNKKYALAERQRQQLIEETEMKKKMLEEKREERLGSLDKRLRQQMRLFDGEVEVIEDLAWPDVEQLEEESSLPELTDAMQRVIDAALDDGPPNQVLSEGFRLQLRRADFATLQGLNWLNDEVINFYMNMLTERGKQDGFSNTYAFNTFFYPKLIAGGHNAVKRWTRRVDVFSHHYLVMPVHLGVHWCLCLLVFASGLFGQVVFMKEKSIRYYDSMGGDNNQCLNAIRQYLHDESLEKRKIQLDLSEWSTETVKDIPQQMNGSDCGMFSCMYAESLTRGAKITFTQKDMPYFRRRMVYELLKKQLL